MYNLPLNHLLFPKHTIFLTFKPLYMRFSLSGIPSRPLSPTNARFSPTDLSFLLLQSQVPSLCVPTAPPA